MNDRLACLAGVCGVALVWLFIGAAGIERPQPERDMCTVGAGPPVARSAYIDAMLEADDLEGLAEQRKFAERIVRVIGPRLADENEDEVGPALAKLGEHGRAVLWRALIAERDETRIAAASAIESITQPSTIDLRSLFSSLRVNGEWAGWIAETVFYWGPTPLPGLLSLVESGIASDDEDDTQLTSVAWSVGIDAALPLAQLFVSSVGAIRVRAMRCLIELEPGHAAPAASLLQRYLLRCSASERTQILDVLSQADCDLTAETQRIVLTEIGAAATPRDCALLSRCDRYPEIRRRLLLASESNDATLALLRAEGMSAAVRERCVKALDASDPTMFLWDLALHGPRLAPIVGEMAALGHGWGAHDPWQHAMYAVGPVAIPHLLPMLGGGDWGARDGAVTVLGAFGPKARDAVPRLRTLAQAGSRNALNALVSVDPDNSQTMALVIAALQEPKDRIDLLGLLGSLGSTARVAGPALRALLAERHEVEDEEEVFEIGLALAAIGQMDVAAIELFTRALGSREVNCRRDAARVFYVAGRAAAPALPALRHASRDCSPSVARWATMAADGAAGSVEATRAMLRGSDRAFEVLTNLLWVSAVRGHPLDARLVPDIARASRSGDWFERELAVYLLLGLGEVGKPHLRTVADDTQESDSLRALARTSK